MFSSSSRSSRRQKEDICILAARTPVPDEIRKRRAPECTDYGTNREEEWPEYFFCSNCKAYENELSWRPLLNRESNKKFACKGGHKNYDHPTVMKKSWCRSMVDIPDVNTDNPKRDPSSGKVGKPRKKRKLGIASYLDKLFEEKDKILTNASRVKAKYHYVLNEKTKLINRVTFLENKLEETKSRTGYVTEKVNFEEDVSQALTNIIKLHYARFGKKRVSNGIANVVYSSTFMNGAIKDELHKRVKKEYRDVFSPRNILREMDVNSGSLNLGAIEMLRNIEGIRKHCIGLIPSSTSIQRVAHQLSKYGDELIPFESFETTTGEGIKFDCEKVGNLLLQMYGLKEKAKNRSINLSVATDGHKVTNNILQVIAGVKVNDIAATCPLTGQPVSPQTRNICWPLLIVMGQENEYMYRTYIKPLYSWWEEASEVDSETGNSKKFNGIKPLKISSCSDMSATWKMTGKGGTAKVKEFFCHCCDTTSDEIAHHNSRYCEFCTDFLEETDEWTDNWKCYHKEIMTSSYYDELSKEYEEMMSALCVSLEEIDQNSVLNVITHDETEKISDPRSIDYLPQSLEEASKFQDLLVEECLLRDMDIVDKTTSTLQSELKEALQNEAHLKKLKDRLKHCTPAEGMCFVLLQWIPCILHMENRIGIKFFTLLLIEGLSHAKGLSHPKYQHTSKKEREEAFFSAIEDKINNKILGSGLNKWQFCVPRENSNTAGEGTVIGIINMENTKARTIVENIDDLVDLCLPPSDLGRKNKWLKAVSHYRDSMTILRKKDGNYTTEELKQYKIHTSIFGNLWIELHQHRGMTNYTHMKISGHVLEHMIEWGNLYRYSQQGWEALNSLIKRFFFMRTNKGGGAKGARSRLVPIARLFQRRLLWMSGLAQKFLAAEDKKKLAEKTSKGTVNDDDADDDFEYYDELVHV